MEIENNRSICSFKICVEGQRTEILFNLFKRNYKYLQSIIEIYLVYVFDYIFLFKLYSFSAIFKGLCRVLGLVIDVDAKHIDESAKILVANHLSILDRLAVNAMIACSTVSPFKKLP